MTHSISRRFFAMFGCASLLPTVGFAQQQGAEAEEKVFYISCEVPETTINIGDYEINFRISGSVSKTPGMISQFKGVMRIPLSGKMVTPGDALRDVFLYLSFSMAENRGSGTFRFPQGWSAFRLEEMVIDRRMPLPRALPSRSEIAIVLETVSTGPGPDDWEYIDYIDDSYKLRSQSNLPVPFVADFGQPEAGVIDFFTRPIAFDKAGNEIKIPFPMEVVAETMREFSEPIFRQSRAAIESGEINQDGITIGEYCVSRKSGGSSCFLTTATVDCVGLPDDCFELQALRNLRDFHLARTAEGTLLVEEYYSIAPKIIRAVNARPKSAKIWRRAYWRYILPCAILVVVGFRSRAISHYRKMVSELSNYIS